MGVVAFGLGERAPRRQYDELIDACPQAFIQQTTLWAEIVSGIGPDEPIFLMAIEHGAAVAGLPLYLYQGPAGSILTSVPQLGPLGGVFVRPGPAAEEAYSALLAEADRIARERGCIALTLITSPLRDDLDLYVRHLVPDLIFENFTQVVDLQRVIDGGRWILPDNSNGNPGKTIKAAKAAGLTAKQPESEHEFDRWLAVHQQRNRELGLSPCPEALLRNIQSLAIPKRCAFLQLVLAGDQVAAGSLFIQHREVCDVYLISMNSEFKRKAPNYLVFEQALIEMARRGVRWLNWQSSPSRGDGVYRFKKQWGSEERLYYFVTKLYGDPARLQSLGAEGLRKGYPGHYVVPFGVFEAGFGQRRFRKA